MKKILFIVPYPPKSAPSQRFRFEQYKDFLEEKEFHVTYSPFFDDATWNILYKEGYFLRKFILIFRSFLRRFLLLLGLSKYDYIFIHREMAPIGPPVFEFLIAKILRRKFVYDFDDAIWLPNYSTANSNFEKLKMYTKVNKIMKWAYVISAGNDYLANYARKFNNNVRVIPTTIDTENYHNILCNQDEKPTIIGWTGSHSTMRYLDFLIPILEDLEKDYDFVFRVISDKKPEFKLESLEFVKWNKETEIQDLSKIQIGVMPLTEDQWAEGKCGFKGLQYMSLGIVAVMSPVGVNRKIIQDGVNGFLVETPKDWKKILTELLQDDERRKTIGLAGRNRIIESYSVLSQKENYLQFFQ